VGDSGLLSDRIHFDLQPDLAHLVGLTLVGA
jgi:hypothetical protein